MRMNAKKKEVASTDLFKYLETLPRASILSLYEDPSRGNYAAKIILQKLPELARQFTIRLSVCGGEFPYDKITKWSTTRTKRDVKLALSRMEALSVIDPIKLNEDPDESIQKSSDGSHRILDKIDPQANITLSAPFKKALQISLTSLSPAPYPELSNAELEKYINNEKKNPTPRKKYPNKAPTPTELETFTQKRWDSVLHYLVGTDDDNYEDPNEAIKQFLVQTGLMQEDPDYRGSHDAPLMISSKGYEFMLQDVHVQVWQFILKYIQSASRQAQETDTFQREALLFLICLSYCKVGKAYPAGALAKSTRIIMKDFSLFGLVYICKFGGITMFFPTRVAVNLVVGGLADGAAAAAGSASESTSVAALSSSAAATRVLENALEEPIPSKNHIAIIVQTNFQVCAYTTSSLHVSMLGLFCDVTTYRRLPNVIFYRITRDSVKGAFKLGIQARQILKFLKMHAHPRLRTGDQPLIPGNVEDQIILWDRERTRVKMKEVYSLQCRNESEYEAVRQYAQDRDAFGWGSEAKLRIMVDYEMAEQTVAFVRRWRTKLAQRG
jgi:transcription initiation factor TFIIH subunit 4